MSNATLAMTPKLNRYIVDKGLREDALQRRMREETAQLRYKSMQISPEQGAFMSMLMSLIGAKKVLEIGVFTGYSALCMAYGMGKAGQIIGIDRTEDWVNLAKGYWAEAGVDGMIEVRLGDALEKVEELLAEDDQLESFDFVFIDADKRRVDDYYEAALRLVKPGGLIGVDNVLWYGHVAEEAVGDMHATAMKAINDKISKDERVDISMVPIGDGITLCKKR